MKGYFVETVASHFNEKETPAYVFSCEFFKLFGTASLYSTCERLAVLGKNLKKFTINYDFAK